MIPKTIHQVWIGDPMPEKYRRWSDRWQRLNPEWSYCLWGEEAAGLLPTSLYPLYAKATSHAQRSDFLRLAIVACHGGWYLDSDFEPLREIGTLLDGCELAVFQSEKGTICNGSFAAVPEHLFLLEYMRIIPTKFVPSQGNSIGPPVMSELVRRWPSSGVRTVPLRTMFPVTWLEHRSRRPAILYPETIAMHHFAASWIKPKTACSRCCK